MLRVCVAGSSPFGATPVLCCRAYRASRLYATPACDTCANRHRTTLKTIENRCTGERLASCHRPICGSGAAWRLSCNACAAARTNGNPRSVARAPLWRAAADRLFWNGRRLYAYEHTTSDLASGLARVDSVLAPELSLSPRRAGVRARVGLNGARRYSARPGRSVGSVLRRRFEQPARESCLTAKRIARVIDETRFTLTGARRPGEVRCHRAVAAAPPLKIARCDINDCF